MAEQKPAVPCICGANLIPLDDDGDYPMWMHETITRACKTPVPAAGMPTKKDRSDLSERLADTGRRLDKAGAEIRDLKAKADAVIERLERLDNAHLEPAAVRRATLNQVWDKLVDAGDMTGATIVMKMIGSGAWD